MDLTVEQIKTAISKKQIGAISLDTSIFDRLGRSLEWGLLKRLAQFSSTDIAVVLSDVVRRELRAHLISEAAEAQVSLNRALKQVGNSWLASMKQRNAASAILLGTQTPELIADNRLKRFLEDTGTEVACAEEFASMNELLNRYFESRPPFGSGQAKKHEFPDALAVLTLEAWAAKRDTQVLIVTRDGDWKRYLTDSPRLVGIDDLGTALGCFQAESALYITSQLSEHLSKVASHEIVAEIKAALADQSWKIEFWVEADSQFSVAEEDTEAEFGEIEIVGLNDGSALELVEYDENSDSIDHDEIPMGSTNVSRQAEFTASALVTFGGTLPDKPKVAQVELLSQREHLDVGEVEPAWMSDGENFEN